MRTPLFNSHPFKSCLRILAAVVLIPATGISQDSTSDSARIVVNAAHNLGPVNPLIFGHNIEAADCWGVFTSFHTKSNDGEGAWDPVKRDFVPGTMEFLDKIRVGALRYPGGSLSSNFDWKKAVGPLSSRPDFQFGVDEYMKLCRRLGAEPVFTVSDHHGTAEEAAELVEYLNAPATPEHPWAMKRAEWGHPEPYGVKWFELGNETNMGSHNLKPFKKPTPAQYVEWAKDYNRKMKAVDPSIKVGVISYAAVDINTVNEPWNQTVFREAPSFADFVVVHLYAPNVRKGASEAELEKGIHASMASANELGAILLDYHKAIRAASGKDLPLAITEYNVYAVQDDPIPYRFSFAAGLQIADFMRLCLDPQYGVVMANYWHIMNGYWGVIRGTSAHAPYSFFRLWASHLGNKLVKTTIDSPKGEFEGGFGISQARGDVYQPEKTLGECTLPPSFPASPITTKGAVIKAEDNGQVVVEFQKTVGSSYPELFHLAVPSAGKGPTTFRISFEGKMESDSPGRAVDYGEFGIGAVDTRGWEVTRSGIAILGLENATDWEPFSGTYTTRDDAKSIAVIARWAAKQEFSGRMRIRNLKVETMQNDVFPAYPLLTATATKTEDGKSLYLVVFNKSLDRPIPCDLVIEGFDPATVTYRQLADPPKSITEASEKVGQITPEESGRFRQTFPPCSMTAITFTKKTPETLSRK